jgi:hypothetical protein
MVVGSLIVWQLIKLNRAARVSNIAMISKSDIINFWGVWGSSFNIGIGTLGSAIRVIKKIILLPA